MNPAVPPSPSTVSPAKKVLIVQGDTRRSRRLAMAFAAAGIDVRAFSEFEAAVSGAREEWFDLAVADETLVTNEGVSIGEAFQSVRPTLSVLLLTDDPKRQGVGDRERANVVAVMGNGEDPRPVLQQAWEIMYSVTTPDEKLQVTPDELAAVERWLDATSGDEDRHTPPLNFSPEKFLLQLAREREDLRVRVKRLEEEKEGMAAELKTLLSQGLEVQKLEAELSQLHDERELIDAAQAAIDGKARDLSETRALISRERSAIESDRERLHALGAANGGAEAGLAEERSELAKWRLRLQEEEERLAGCAAQVRKELMQLTREKRRWHDDLEVFRAQEENLRAYEARLRRIEVEMETARHSVPAASSPESGPASGSSSAFEFPPGETGMRDAWSRLQRTSELLEADRADLRDNRLAIQEHESALRRREHELRDRELRMEMWEKKQSESGLPVSKNTPNSSMPVAAIKHLTRAPMDVAKVVVGAVRRVGSTPPSEE